MIRINEYLNMGKEPEIRSLFYFEFEKQFMEDGIRCIPMIVRYKLDMVAIKLSLAAWCKFSMNERFLLSTLPTESIDEMTRYDSILSLLIWNYTACIPQRMSENYGLPAMDKDVFDQVQSRCKQYDKILTWSEWLALTDLERFTLSKLLKPGHESKNFLPALKEFGLIHETISLWA